MFIKKFKFYLIILLFYQTPLYPKSVSFSDFGSQNLSKYFSGIVAFDNQENTLALNFFNSSKILLNKHDAYLKKYIYSLVLENKIPKAINILKKNNNNTDLFDTRLLLILDSLQKKDLDKAYIYVTDTNKIVTNDRLASAILENLKQYIYVFKEKKILNSKKKFGQLSVISETFQRCYLQDENTENFFLNLVNDPRNDFTRYIYFYLSYLIENNRIGDAKKITNKIDYINSSLLLSQGKSWIDNENAQKFTEVFSCKNYNDIISEFLFLISNLYSSQNDYKKSNFYLNLSNFLNPKFVFNLSLVAENQYSNKQFNKVKKTLKNFKKDNDFYYWYRVKKEALIISKNINESESLRYLSEKFDNIENPNTKFLFDIANFYRNSKKYKEAIKYYSKIMEILDDDSEIKPDILYRRGGSYERIGEYEKADADLLNSLRLNPDDAHVLNYLAYSWLERNYKIEEAIDMLEVAYEAESDDPYIIDSIGWAYFLIDDFIKAEKFLKRAVELMPDDPIVNDHYGDILWKLGRQIQARYFWSNVLVMDDIEEEMLEKINIKLVKGLKNS